MKTKQEIKNLLNRVRFNSQNDVDAVKRFLDGIGIESGGTDKNMFQRDITTARFFITCATQHVFANQIPLETLVDLGIQIYNLCEGSIKSQLTIVASEESNVVMIGEHMGLYRNGLIDTCHVFGSITTSYDKPYRLSKFTVIDVSKPLETGRCYQVVIPNIGVYDENAIVPGTHYMLYLGNGYWLLNGSVYCNVIEISRVKIRILEEVK